MTYVDGRANTFEAERYSARHRRFVIRTEEPRPPSAMEEKIAGRASPLREGQASTIGQRQLSIPAARGINHVAREVGDRPKIAVPQRQDSGTSTARSDVVEGLYAAPANVPSIVIPGVLLS